MRARRGAVELAARILHLRDTTSSVPLSLSKERVGLRSLLRFSIVLLSPGALAVRS